MFLRSRRFAGRVVCGAVILAAGGTLAFPAAGTAKPKKPDLVVQQFQFVPAPGISGAIPHVVLESRRNRRLQPVLRGQERWQGASPGSDLAVIVNKTEFAKFTLSR